MDGAQITSQVFIPFPRDDGMLSVDDGDLISASEAHTYYTQILGNESDSVWSVSNTEAHGETVPGIPTPEPGRPSHASIDFRGKTDKECRKIAKKLKALAAARGCQYLPA